MGKRGPPKGTAVRKGSPNKTSDKATLLKLVEDHADVISKLKEEVASKDQALKLSEQVACKNQVSKLEVEVASLKEAKGATARILSEIVRRQDLGMRMAAVRCHQSGMRVAVRPGVPAPVGVKGARDACDEDGPGYSVRKGTRCAPIATE